MYHNQFLDLTIQKSDYDVNKRIMMQKLDPRSAGLMPTKIGLVDRKSVTLYVSLPALYTVLALKQLHFFYYFLLAVSE